MNATFNVKCCFYFTNLNVVLQVFVNSIQNFRHKLAYRWFGTLKKPCKKR